MIQLSHHDLILSGVLQAESVGQMERQRGHVRAKRYLVCRGV